MTARHHDYTDIDPAVEARIDELMGRMTLADKIGQMCQIGLDPKRPELLDVCRQGRVGSVLAYLGPKAMNDLQREVVENSPLGIPLLIGGDIIHGCQTTFPIPLAEACSFSPELAERTARAAADEASARGLHLILAPMVDVSRDPRWGRVAEGAGEDAQLGSELAAARTRGFQAADLAAGVRTAACPKHYIAYGAAEAGRDYNSVDLSENLLRDVYLPPFLAAFDAGAPVVMSAFHDLSGVPCSANPFTLKTILRDELDWPGVVLSDYNAVAELIAHGVAADEYAACVLAVNTGVDMDMGPGLYGEHLPAAVEAGDVTIETIDASVRRILRLKFRLGLFEKPYVDPAVEKRIALSTEKRVLAFEAACRSIVLLKNDDDLLPLSPESGRVAVIGPLADDRETPLGCWACWHCCQDAMPTSILAGLQAAAGKGLHIDHVPGCAVDAPGDDGFAKAVAAAKKADVVIAVLGEDQHMSGEAQSRAYLPLPGRQQALLERLKATGTPVVLVLQNGRPLVLTEAEPHADAIIEAWHLGLSAGEAVAAVLFGEANPSGKLAMSFPRCEGQIPIHYGIRPTGRPAWGEGTKQFDEPFKSRYRDEINSPLYPFGYGLSYTTFALDQLVVHTPTVSIDEQVRLSVRLTNTGDRDGVETLQVYTRDRVASMARPIRELKAFRQVALSPGESQTVEFSVPAASLGFHNVDMRYVVEPGQFDLFVGTSSVGGLEETFRVVECS